MMTETEAAARDMETAPDDTIDATTSGGEPGGATETDATTGAAGGGDATTGASATHGPPPGTDAPAPTADSRNLAVVAHLSALVGLAGVPSFIGPLVVWLLHRGRDPWVAEQARDALNFNLSLLVYAGAALALTILTVGLGLLVVVPAAIVVATGWLVVTVLAAIRAADGGRYRYPLTLQLIA
jgi:uncharacterized Tic20 family protein